MHSRHFAAALAFTGLVAAPAFGQTLTQSWTHNNTFSGGVAYDYVNDTIWVFDSAADRIEQYSRTGTFLMGFAAPAVGTSPIPIGGFVHPVTGNLWIGDETEMVYEITQQGVLTGVQWSTTPTITDVSALTHDPATDTVYISNDSSQLVAEFDLAGNPIRQFGVGGAGSVDGDGFAYNPITGTFYLGEDTGDQVIEVDAMGTFVNSWPNLPPGISPEGLAVDTRNGALIIGGGNASVFEVAGIVPPCPAGTVAMAYGMGCNDSGGSLPIAHVSDCPTPGRPLSFGAEFTSTINTGFGFVVVGFNSISIPLATFGAPNCTALTSPFPPTLFAVLPVANGRTGFTVPAWPFVSGSGATVQFGIFPDPGAASGGPLPISLTNGVAASG